MLKDPLGFIRCLLQAEKMYLVNTENFKLEKFEGRKIPLYATLSHTWDKDEITLQEMQLGVADKNAGYEKVKRTCLIAKTHGFDYVWIDTCCIDKTSSAELSEAINSMYHWYQDSGICYAYLADVLVMDQLLNSRWFTRGWTLQELIAPSIVIFLNKEWQQIGTKLGLGSIISKVTGVPNSILQGANPQSASLAERMSWAANRKTTRIEDLAYSLMGIFNVNMPLLYGEGKRAFYRLQEEIMKVSDDHSLFAWKGLASSFNSLLASSPAAFSTCSKIIPLDSYNALSGPFTVNNKGIYLKLRIMNAESKPANSCLALLPCTVKGELAKKVGIYVEAAPESEEYFRRVYTGYLEIVSIKDSALPRNVEKLFCFERRRQISERQLPLERAIERGNQALMEFLFEQGATFGFQCGNNQELVYKAIGSGHAGMVKLLLEKGVDLESKDCAGWTGLTIAAGNGHESVVKLLLEKGADLESKDRNDWTALTIAAGNGHEAVVELLLEKGADFESKDGNGWTALTAAARNGHEAVVKLLIEKGADIESKDGDGLTALTAAARYGHEGVVELLIEKGANSGKR